MKTRQSRQRVYLAETVSPPEISEDSAPNTSPSDDSEFEHDLDPDPPPMIVSQEGPGWTDSQISAWNSVFRAQVVREI